MMSRVALPIWQLEIAITITWERRRQQIICLFFYRLKLTEERTRTRAHASVCVASLAPLHAIACRKRLSSDILSSI